MSDTSGNKTPLQTTARDTDKGILGSVQPTCRRLAQRSAERAFSLREAWKRAPTHHNPTPPPLGNMAPLSPRRLLPALGRAFAPAGGVRTATRQPVLIDTARHSDPAAAIAALLRVDPERVQWLGWRERDAGTSNAAHAVPTKKNGRPPAAAPSAAALKKRAQRAKARAAKQAPTTSPKENTHV
jgi:hypothetical protein